MSKRTEFLAGDRPDDIALFLSEDILSGTDKLAEHGDSVEGGVVLVLDGETGRSVFNRVTGMDAMTFAQQAMNQTSAIDPELAGGDCPKAEENLDEEHEARFIFAFSEEQNEEVGDLYAEGDVIHAYAHCECGAAYSNRWVADEV